MQIHIIAVGKHMPDWIQAGFVEYTHRMPANYKINLIEINAEKRLKSANINKLCELEETKIKAAIPNNSRVISLDRIGKIIDTKMLAKSLQTWHDNQQDISLIIGGPEGLSANFLKASNEIWSLSALTLPHPLVRVVLAEQLYRAWSILVNHPYHR